MKCYSVNLNIQSTQRSDYRPQVEGKFRRRLLSQEAWMGVYWLSMEEEKVEDKLRQLWQT